MSNFYDSDSYIKELSPKDFDKTFPWILNNKGKCVVLYYAPWCPHCVHAKDMWKDFGAAVKKSGKKVSVYAFNCEGPANNKSNKAHLGKMREDNPGLVTGFPTIQIYEGGKPTETYDGERSVKALVAYF